MIQHTIRVNGKSSFYLDATAFCSYDEFYEMGSLPLESYCQFLTPKQHFLEYISRKVADVSSQHEADRRLVLAFKDGEEQAMLRAARMVCRAIADNGLDSSEFTLMCIPASSRMKNQVRFSRFMKMVCRETQVMNGYGLVKVTADRKEVHTGGSRRRCNYVLPDDLAGRKIILFDDVETTGKTFASFAGELEHRGACVIQGIFLAKAMPF